MEDTWEMVGKPLLPRAHRGQEGARLGYTSYFILAEPHSPEEEWAGGQGL